MSASQLVLDLQVSHLSKTPIFLTSCFPGIIELLTKAFKGFTYEGMDYKEDLRRRDMMDLPKYWHRDDAIILWDATFNYVKEMTDVFYVSDDDVLEDWELQAWVEDIFNHGFSQLEGTVKPGIGIPSKLNSKEELVILKTYKCNTEMFSKHQVGYLQKIIYTSSVRHAFYFYSFE